MTRWFEDISVDDAFPLGEHTFSAAEIIRFGQNYDPQYFHTSETEAPQSEFGGLVASGWHTVCVGQRKMVDALTTEAQRLQALGQEPGVSGPSPGVNEMVFKSPVRPGDTVTYILTVANKRTSNSMPGWGLLFNRIAATNQNGALVYSAELVSFSKLRDFKPTFGLRLALWASTVPLLKQLIRR